MRWCHKNLALTVAEEPSIAPACSKVTKLVAQHGRFHTEVEPSLVEALASRIAPLFDGVIGLKILSNLCDKRRATAHCTLSFAQSDPYRAIEGG